MVYLSIILFVLMHLLNTTKLNIFQIEFTRSEIKWLKKKLITVNKKMLIRLSKGVFVSFPFIKVFCCFIFYSSNNLQTSLDEFIIPSINQIFQSINHSADFYLWTYLPTNSISDFQIIVAL